MTRDTDNPTPARSTANPPADPGLPPANDPGGAHAKGYSADPDPGVPNATEPVPLVNAPPGGIHVPERDPGVRPTGRKESPDDPNNRIVDPE